MFVALHELAHSMQYNYAKNQNGQTLHDTEFRKCEEFLLNIGKHLGMIIPENIPNRLHCGYSMPNPNNSL